MVYTANVTVNPHMTIGQVHDHLYGANLEHIGRSIYGGHWAEMLKSRKFAGHDNMFIGLSEGLQHQNLSFGIIEPWTSVNPDYHNVLYVHDNTIFYSGQQSQRITIRRSDGQFHGIEQRGLTLEAGRTYVLRVVLLGQGQPIKIHLFDQTWHINRVPSEWTTLSHTFIPKTTSMDASLQILTQVQGDLWIGCVSLMPADNLGGHRADVVAALKEWQPTFMRWPGGNFASGYHWLNGLGDIDKRPSYLDPAWSLWEPNDVGTDEFMVLCKLVGSEPILTVNMGNGSPEEAAAWVEYCNGVASTHYGALRVANGHHEPYNVKTWFVGNEQFGNWQVGHCDAETYAHRFRNFARAMRAIDSDLRLIAVGVPTDLYGHWNELVLNDIQSEMDALSVHYYSIRTEKWEQPPRAEQLYWPKVASAHEVALMLDKTIDIVKHYSNPPVPIAFDEWNTYVGGKAPDFFEDYGIADAVYVGALMNACLQRCDRIVMSAIFNLINVMGNYRVTSTTIWKTPSSLVLELFTHYRGRLGIACSVDSSTVVTPAAGNLPAFDAIPLTDAAATFDPQTNIVYISVVNRSPEHEVKLTLNGLTRSGAATVHYVSGESPFALNNEHDPRAVTIHTTLWESGDDNLSLPPHSVSIIEIATIF